MKISIDLSYSKYEFIYRPTHHAQLMTCVVEDKFGGTSDYKFKSEEHALACLLDKIGEADKNKIEIVWNA